MDNAVEVNNLKKAVEVNGLSFGYNENKIFDNVSFSVDKGDYLGIIGPNGSGKSTLIRLMLNMISPMKGEIILLGHNIKNFPHWSKVGYISQKANAINISFPATVEEILKANINTSGRQGIATSRRAFLKEKIYRALEIVGMESCGKELIGNLSGGQQQRVFIARMLVNEPEIMFLDEPTSGIDARSEEAVYCLLARLNSEMGITIVMATHDIGAITVHANKIAFTGNKNVIVQDSGDEIDEKSINDLYGYRVNFRVQRHECGNCRNSSPGKEEDQHV